MDLICISNQDNNILPILLFVSYIIFSNIPGIEFFYSSEFLHILDGKIMNTLYVRFDVDINNKIVS